MTSTSRNAMQLHVPAIAGAPAYVVVGVETRDRFPAS
jgi:hypothetical protein